MAVAGIVLYTHSLLDTAASLSHLPGVGVNDTFHTLFWGDDLEEGSSAVLRCIATSGALTPGKWRYVVGSGFLFDAVSGAIFKLIPQAGGIVDIRAVGITCNGVVNGHHSRFANLVSAAKEFGWFLTNRAPGGNMQTATANGHAFKIAETVNCQQLNCDLVFQAGDQGDVVGGVRFWTGVEPNITTKVTAAGETKAVAVLAGGNANAREPLRQKIHVQGDGLFNVKGSATVIGIWLGNNSGPMSEYEFKVSYCNVGVAITGDGSSQEKHPYRIHALYCNHAVTAQKVGSTNVNTVTIELHGASCWHWYTESDGFDGSVYVRFNCESRNDPADGTPAVFIRGGKSGGTTLAGTLRGVNGRYILIADKSSSAGIDTLVFDYLKIMDAYGQIDLRRARRISGQLHCFEMKNPNNGSPPMASIKFGRVIFPDLYVNLERCTALYGVEIGDATNYSVEATIGPLNVQMGNTDPYGGSFPTTYTALRIVKMVKGTVNAPFLMGQVLLEAAATDVDVNLNKDNQRYALTRMPGESCSVRYGWNLAP